MTKLHHDNDNFSFKKKNFLLYLKCPYLLFEKDNHRKNLKDKRNKHDYLI